MNTTPIHELYLAGIVALSLVLPLMASALAPKNPGGSRPWLRIVWVGQTLGGVGGLLVIFSPFHPSIGLMIAVASSAVCGWLLHRQLLPSQAAASSDPL